MGAREALSAGLKAFSIYLIVQFILFFIFTASGVSVNPVAGTIILVLTLVNILAMFVNAARWYSQTKDVNRLSSRKDVKGLVRVLGNQSLDWRIRGEAAQALERIGPEARQAVPMLIETLRKQGASNLLASAASALGRIDESSLLGEWDRIVRLYHLPSNPVGWSDYWAIRRALASMGPCIVPKLKSGLNDTKKAVRKHTADILGDMGRDAVEAAPDLVKVLMGEDLGVREEAVKALSRIGGQAVPILVRELANENVEIRLYAIRAIGGMGSEAEDAVPSLIRSLREDEWGVKERAAEALGNIGLKAEASLPALKEALAEAFKAVEYKQGLRPRELLLPLAKAVAKIATDRETILLLSEKFVVSDRWDEKEALLLSLSEFGQSVLVPEVLEIVDIQTGIADFIYEHYHYMEDELVGYYRIPEWVVEALRKLGYHDSRIGFRT